MIDSKPKVKKPAMVRCLVDKVWIHDGRTMALGDDVAVPVEIAKLLIKNKQAVKVDG